jgi:hypothetical protein
MRCFYYSDDFRLGKVQWTMSISGLVLFAKVAFISKPPLFA